MKIFIVEDDRVLSLILTKMVQNIGYEVVGTSESGKESIQLIKEKTPDMILMDICLRDQIDGIQVAGEILKHYSPYIIYITGNSDKAHKMRAKKIGYHDFLVKPVNMNELKSAMSRL